MKFWAVRNAFREYFGDEIYIKRNDVDDSEPRFTDPGWTMPGSTWWKTISLADFTRIFGFTPDYASKHAIYIDESPDIATQNESINKPAERMIILED